MTDGTSGVILEKKTPGEIPERTLENPEESQKELRK